MNTIGAIASAAQIMLEAVFFVVQAASLFFIFYPSIVGYAGMRNKRQPVVALKKTKFAALVCAHNEEAVVGQIVKNIKNVDYPDHLIDLYVICDNCDDKTADAVRANGGAAMERHDLSKQGKGHGLEWMFAKLWDMEKQGKTYDAVAMFDADNLVNKNFFTEINRKLSEGHEVVQGYLDSKNPKDTWITKSYAFAYWATNRIYQLSRENMNLSAQIGGTGVVVATSALKKIGWGSTSLTEDLEFTQRYILQTGKRVAWAHEAKIYDEKPLDMKSSWKQRVRWMQGHSACIMKFAVPLLKATLKERKMLYFDAFIYLISPLRAVLTAFFVVFFILSLFGVQIADWSHLNTPWVFILTSALYISLPLAGLVAENKSKHILWYMPTLIYSLTWYPIILIGFVKRNQTVWSHTKHTRTVNEGENVA